VLAAIAVVLGLTACGKSSDEGGGGSGGNVVIGASIPLSGELAGFGAFQKWGYEHAVKKVNEEGGLEIEGEKRKVELKLLDDKSNPNDTSANTQRLISQDHVTAMLGSCTPPLVNAGAVIAERSKMPMITPCEPLGAFRPVKEWEWVWAVFFDESEVTELPFKMLKETGKEAETNKKVAILHDNEPDGINFSKLWEEDAKKYGYEVVLDEQFPVGQTTFNTTVTKAKSSEADVVVVQSVPPAAVAIRKTMASEGYTPKVLAMEKGGEPAQFAEATGKLSEGVLVGAYWDPSFPYPEAENLAKEFQEQTGNSPSQHIADTEAVATVLLEAIKTANSTDSTKINEAIAKTNLTTVVGPVKFASDHTSTIPSVESQWQNGEPKIVFPESRATGKLIFPLP
jgi:branched-chain amino acid transport system substrate-binding protein